MHALSLRAAFAVFALLVTVSASSQVQPEPAAATTAPSPATAIDPLAEAIRERVDHLRYASEHDGTDHVVRGRRIVLTDIVARYYESQQFQPKWRDPARLDLLMAALADLVDDGLDPQAALDRPRFRVDGELVRLEEIEEKYPTEDTPDSGKREIENGKADEDRDKIANSEAQNGELLGTLSSKGGVGAHGHDGIHDRCGEHVGDGV